MPLESGRSKLLTQNHAQLWRKQLLARHDKGNVALNQLLALTRAQARHGDNQWGWKCLTDALRT